MKIKKILIISLGSIGRRHLKIIKQLRPEIKVNILRRKIQINQFDEEEQLIEKTFTNLKEALKDGPDAVIIASPAKLHIEQSLEILKANIPLLIEKPISDNLKSCFKLKELSKKNKSLITVGYVLRYSKSLNEFKKIINENHIGKNLYAEIKCASFLPEWRKNKDYRESVSAKSSLGGGALLELSHEINYANWLFGPFKNLKSIYTNTKQLEIDVEDIAKIIAINNNNFLLHIHLDFCSNSNERYCKLFGTLGYINLDLNKQLITIKNNNTDKLIKIKVDEKFNDMYINQINHFLDCVEQKKEPIVTIDDAIETLKLITEFDRSKL